MRELPTHQELVTFEEAGVILRKPVTVIRSLISQGHLKPHPVLADRIARQQVRRFALDYDQHAESNAEEGRAVDDSTTQSEWEVPTLRIRS